MFDHTNCSHAHTKVARAACRRQHQAALDESVRRHPSNHIPQQRRGSRLPSMIAPKLRDVIDLAKEKGLKIRLVTDAPEGVDQAFVILNPKKTDCQLVAEAFQAASKGREGRAEFYHVENGRSRQLSHQRALLDVDDIASRA